MPVIALSLRVIPRARRSAIAGRRGEAWLVRVQAPPVDDAANAAVRELLAEVLGVPLRNIAIVAGQRARDKRVSVAGIGEADAVVRLTRASDPPRVPRA